MASYESIPAWSDNCVHSPAKDPAPPKSKLQGDANDPWHRPLIQDSNHATSRGGTSKAPGGKIMAPRPKPNGTSGRAVGSKVK